MTETLPPHCYQPEDIDAVLFFSFGGPRQNSDVLPFLENVTRGKGVPTARLEAVAEHYYHHGGRTPINEQLDALVAAVRADLARRNIVDLPLYVGNRNWTPYVADALRQLYADGHRSVFVVTTSAYSSYSGCRQYRENLAAAAAELAAEGKALTLHKAEHYGGTPGFIAAHTDAVRRALGELDDSASKYVAFVTHSIPVTMNQNSGPEGNAYQDQHQHVANAVMAELNQPDIAFDLVYCSRSGPPSMPWTEPDINDHLRSISATHQGVVVAPIGFISDHMEVIHDLDTEAAETAAELGLGFARSDTPLTHPAFVRELGDLITRRVARSCPVDCCPNSRAPQTPAACGEVTK